MEANFERLPEADLAQLSNFVGGRFGLHFPPDRRADLERALHSAARDRSVGAAVYLARLLGNLATDSELQALAAHLTVGETYFFRDPAIFDALEQTVLPSLIAERCPANRQLRIWSAGCATGEEPYSLAILLTRLIADLRDWHIAIYATDLNERALERAREGLYGEWSFRATPHWIRNKYFLPTADRQWAISPDISQLVRFSQLNLIESTSPEWAQAMDLIVCRNVLMYLTAEANGTVIANLHRRLSPTGWLAVSPAEVSPTLFSAFTRAVHSGATFYRKGATPTIATHANPGVPQMQPVEEREPDRAAIVDRAGDPTQAARALADQGKLQEALRLCERAIASGHGNATVHYLRAAILDEQGFLQEAARALRTAVYLDPTFAIAHFALGNLALKRGKKDEYLRHYENTLGVLFTYQQDEILPESGGLTAGRLREIISLKTNGNLTPTAGSAEREQR